MKKLITLTWFLILIVIYVIGIISCAPYKEEKDPYLKYGDTILIGPCKYARYTTLRGSGLFCIKHSSFNKK